MKAPVNQYPFGHRHIAYDFFTKQAHTLRSAALRELFSGSTRPAGNIDRNQKSEKT